MKIKEKVTLVPVILLIIVSSILLIGIMTKKETGAIEMPPANITDEDWNCTLYGHRLVGTQTCTTSYHCSICGYVIKEALGHDFVQSSVTPPTCENSGTNYAKCSRCGELKSVTISALGHNYTSAGCQISYEKDATTHTKVTKCIRCTSTQKSTAENHTGATHPDGKCTVCGQVYQTHSKGTAINSYNKTTTGHTPIYKCSYSGCTETYLGTAENHTGATHLDGKCTTCGQVYQVHGKGAIDNYTKTTTGHTPIYKCSYSGCTETYLGTAENHTGATHPDGKCTVCGQIYQTHSKGTAIDSYTKTTTGHTPIYKCSYSGCTETYQGTIENHSVETWNDNKDGTHSGSCTKCQYVVSGKHTYTNGECTICKAKSSDNTGEDNTEIDTKEWTDTSKISIKLTDITSSLAQKLKISIEGITTNKDSQYYLWLTNGNNKPTLSVDNRNWIRDGYYISSDAERFQNYSLPLTDEGEKILEQNGDIYAWVVESKSNNGKYENKFILEGYKVERPALLSLGKRVSVYFSNDRTNVFNHNINSVNSKDRKLKVKIGIMNDNSILKAIKNNESGALEKLLAYSKSAQATYNGTLKMGESEAVVDKIGITNGQYYYAYFEFDDENGKYYPIEDVMLYQGKVDSTTGKWLYNYLDKDFEWNITDNSTNNGNNNSNNNGNNSGNNNSTSTPTDSTIKPGKLPQTGATPIFITAITVTIGIAGFTIYKIKKLKDVK